MKCDAQNGHRQREKVAARIIGAKISTLLLVFFMPAEKPAVLEIGFVVLATSCGDKETELSKMTVSCYKEGTFIIHNSLLIYKCEEKFQLRRTGFTDSCHVPPIHKVPQ